MSYSFAWLNPNDLEVLAEQNHKTYIIAEPFPHIVIDNFFPEIILDKILEEFPQPKSIDWQKFDRPTEKRLPSTLLLVSIKTIIKKLSPPIFIDIRNLFYKQ